MGDNWVNICASCMEEQYRWQRQEHEELRLMAARAGRMADYHEYERQLQMMSASSASQGD